MAETATIETLLTTADCARIAGVRRTETILDWVASGKWPDPCINGYRCKRWRREDIDRFLKTGRLK